MIIFEKTGKILLDIPVDDASYRYRAIRQGDKVNLVFSLTEHVEIPVYSYVDYQGQRYTLWRPEDLTKHGTRNLEYSATFGGYWELLNTIKYKHLSAIPRKLKFQLTGKPRFFLELLVDNMNQSGVGGWSIGTCIDAPEKTLAFSHEFCLDVLNRLQAAGCDALGLGRKAIWSAWSMADWRDSDFPARLQNLRWTVEVRSEPAA